MTDLFADQREKVNPAYARGELVRLLAVRNQVEAEFVQSLLLEAGVPSLLRRSGGFDVPGFLVAGPRDIMVPSSGLAAAREMVLQGRPPPAEPAGPTPQRLFAVLVAVLVVVGALVWALDALL